MIWPLVCAFLAFAAAGFGYRLARGPSLTARLAGACGLGLCVILAMAGASVTSGRSGLIEPAFALTLLIAVVALAVMKLSRHRSLQISLATAPSEASQ